MRFGIETISKVRKALGPDYPILLRIAGNDFMEGSNTNHEARIFSAETEKAGIDLFNVTGGWHETRVPQLTMGVPRKPTFIWPGESAPLYRGRSFPATASMIPKRPKKSFEAAAQTL